MKKEFHTIEGKAYEKLLKEGRGNYFVTFRYMLPFRLPVEDKTIIELDRCLFLVLQKEYEYYASKDGFGNLPLLHTVIEGTIALKRAQYRSILRDFDREMFQQKSLMDAFDDQLDKLNELMEIINVKYQYLSVHGLHVGEIIGPSLYNLYKSNRDSFLETFTEGLLLLKKPTRLEAERYNTLSSDEIEFIIEEFSEFEKHPTRNMALIARKGEKAFDLYDYNNTIVHYNTVFEVIIVTFIRDYNIMLNIKSEQETMNLLDAGFKNLVKKHFHDALDGLKLKDAEVIKAISKKYMSSSYLVRNEIVHEGGSFGEREAISAMNMVKDLIYMINDNMHNAQSNSFVDIYTKYNINYDPSLYQYIKNKY